MSNYLTEDCYDQIIQHINDKNTLYSCLVANRNFCRKITPKLWSYPFTFLGHGYSPSLVNTYISCLSKAEKRSIGIQTRIYKKPLFPYLLYLKELDYWFLEASTEEWVRTFGCKHKKKLEIKCFFMSFLKLILKKREIHVLRWYNNDKSYRMPDIKHLFKAFNFKKLHCGGYQLCPSFYRDLLSKGCTKIVELDILHHHKVKDRSLATLIKRQKELQYITFRSLSGGMSYLFDSLGFQAHSLVSVRFEDTDFTDVSLKGILLCSNLKTMEFLECRTDDVDKFWEPFIKTFEIQLSKFTLVQTLTIPLAIETILMKSNSELEKVTVDKIVIESMPNFFEVLKYYCININYLKFSFAESEFLQTILDILPSFTKLRYLVIRATRLNIKQELLEMGTSLPKSLRLLDMDFEISARILKKFLDICVAPLERLVLNHNFGFSDEHLKVIMNYAKSMGTLKSIGFTYRSPPEIFIIPCVTEETENEVKKIIKINDPNDQDDCLF